jgi:integrase
VPKQLVQIAAAAIRLSQCPGLGGIGAWVHMLGFRGLRHCKAAGLKHRRIYDLRHTYATWSLAGGVDIYTLSRRMGTSLQMIDRTYGHLAAGADEWERELLDDFDERGRSTNGRYMGAENEEEETS